MGLRWSMENILGWRSQYERMERWYRRIAERSTTPPTKDDQDILDTYLAFFLNCYALRDWFVNSGTIAAHKIDGLIRANRYMRLCRDVCNRSKHLRISRATTDATFSIFREYRVGDEEWNLAIVADELKTDLFKTDLSTLASECRNFWRDFVRDRQPSLPRNPFGESR